jgi:predicted DsbA family dithiol-disulfide isomerase
VASLAHDAAVENANVVADVVEISECPALATQYHVHGVPKIVMNDTVELVGAQPEGALVEALLNAAAC